MSRFRANPTADATDTYGSKNLDALITRGRALANMGRADLSAWSACIPNAYTEAAHRINSRSAFAVFLPPRS